MVKTQRIEVSVHLPGSPLPGVKLFAHETISGLLKATPEDGPIIIVLDRFVEAYQQRLQLPVVKVRQIESSALIYKHSSVYYIAPLP